MADKFTPRTLADTFGFQAEEQELNVNRSGQRAFMKGLMRPFTSEGFTEGVRGNSQAINEAISGFDEQGEPVPQISRGLQLALPGSSPAAVGKGIAGSVVLGAGPVTGKKIAKDFQEMADKFLFQSTEDVVKLMGKVTNSKLKKKLTKKLEPGKLELITIDRGDKPMEIIRGMTLNNEDRVLATIQKTSKNKFKLTTRSFSNTVDSRAKAFDIVRQMNGLFKKTDVSDIKKSLARNKMVLDTSGEIPIIKDRKGNFVGLLNPMPKGKIVVQFEDGTETILNNKSDLVELLGGEFFK